MSCAFDKEKLTGYFDGELEPAERSEVERHIAACSECLRDLGEIKSAALLVRGLPRHRAPRSIAESVSREIAAAGGAARFRVLRGTLLWATAAAAALLIAVNVVFFAGVSKRRAPEAASARPPSASHVLATRPPAEDSGGGAFGRAAEQDRAAPTEYPARRAAQKDASNALRYADEKVGRADGASRGGARPGAPPPAPVTPPPAAETAPGAVLKVEEARNQRGLAGEAKTPLNGALDLEKAKKADDGKKSDLAVLEEKGRASPEDGKAASKPDAERKAGGGGAGAVALTLAAADPAIARSRVEEILRKLGAPVVAAPAPEPAARTGGMFARGAAPKPLTARLTEKQLAEFRKEIAGETALVLVEGRAAEARKRLEETRAKAAAGADPKAREAGSMDKAAKSGAEAPREAPPAEGDGNEALERQQAEPALIRVTFEFTVLEAEPK
jgi:hypothetical protein